MNNIQIGHVPCYKEEIQLLRSFGEEQDKIDGLEVWRNAFLKELKRDFAGYTDRRHALEDAVESLDQGKWYVLEGCDWLREELFGASHS
jgi:hypothetical protein